ncbi:MAG: hypothetical protein KJ077_46460 [Anaerolineae bacterium]|nr:hypothetical protein [Anaerolineae bacterium]
MKKLIKMRQWWGVSILFSCFFLAQAAAMAQSAPGQIKNLVVELWPEYDRPETLVIYHVELASTTVLPAQLTFRLPGYLEKMHVVAVERDDGLVEVSPDAIQLRHEGDDLFLTFSTPVPKVQFEYYDPVIMKQEGQKRELNFDFTAVYETEKATFQVQEPAGAENFAMTPAASASFTGRDGLKYDSIEVTGLAANETFNLTATYTRPSDELSAQLIGGTSPNAEHAADLAVVAEPPPNQNLTLGYTLIGIGATVLLGVAGYWWWSKRKVSTQVARPGPRPSKRKAAAKPAGKATPQSQPILATGSFCYRCGTALREDSNFCHTCGAERRKE